MDARRAVEIAQAESEAARGEPLPVEAAGGRRGRSVVQSVRLPAREFAEIGGCDVPGPAGGNAPAVALQQCSAAAPLPVLGCWGSLRSGLACRRG